MNEKKLALITEGGGMRGAYTAGALAALSDEHINFPYVIGVSAGANTLCGYLSGQLERNKRLYTKWIADKRFLSFQNLFKEGSYFGMDFLFDTLPTELDPFDYETFKKTKTTFKVGLTHCQTGCSIYVQPLLTTSASEAHKMLRASSSLPGISKPVLISGQYYLDGGIADPIPIKKSIQDGNTRHVLILTRNKGYRKHYSKSEHLLAKRYLKQYPAFINAVANRYKRYNETLDFIEQLESEGKVFVLRPLMPLSVDRFEKNPAKLSALYETAYKETKSVLPSLVNWLKS